MSQSAHFEGLSIHEMLRIIGNCRLSGVATIMDRWKVGRLVFVWGGILHASADGHEKLGETLVRKNHISKGDLEDLLQIQERSKKPRPLGKLVKASGVGDYSIIEDEVRSQMKGAFVEILGWQDCAVHFQVDETLAHTNTVDFTLDTQGLLLEAARCTDEQHGGHPSPTHSPNRPARPTRRTPRQVLSQHYW